MDSTQNKSHQTTTQLTRELQRYKRKGINFIVILGYGLIFALLIIYLEFYIFPYYIQYPILCYLQKFSIENLQLIMLLSPQFFGLSLGNLCMYLIYTLKLPFFEKYRTRNNPWPWDENQVQWKIKQVELVKTGSINMFIGIFIFISDSYYGIQLRTDIESFPTLFEMIWQILFSMIIEDTCFYWSHRTLHSPKLYSKIHKKHHEFYTSVSYCAIYAHPLEFVFGNVVPAFVGPKILGQKMHIATLQSWLIFRIGESIDGHCGYDFSWSPYRLLPFSCSAESHNFHHSHNIGNYGSFFTYWDTIMGSDINYNQFIQDKYYKEKVK